MRKYLDFEGWQYVVLFFALMLAMALTVSCKTYVSNTTPIKVHAPASQPDPIPPKGWTFIRSSIDSGYYVQQPQPAKAKNSYNTDSYNKKSHNTETKNKDVGNNEVKQKDVGNAKAKGDGIIGNNNAPIVAKKQAVVGDGNTVEQKSSSLWWLWLLAGILIICGVGWYLKFG